MSFYLKKIHLVTFQSVQLVMAFHNRDKAAGQMEQRLGWMG